MPRMARLEHPGTIVHIMARGIEGRDIFNADSDRLEFLQRLGFALQQTGYKCIVWCLMDNHYHLVVRTTELPMSLLVRPLNGGYARWFNGTYKRQGYLFQNRFKSVLCQDQDYAKQLIRYVHLNPVRKGLVSSVENLESYRWCGHSRILGLPKALGSSFQDRHECLRRFGKSESEAIHAYVRYLNAGLGEQSLSEAGKMSSIEHTEVSGSNKGWPAVIGDPEFAQAAMERHTIRNQRRHRKADYMYVLNRIAEETTRSFSIEAGDLRRRGRENGRSNARAVFCYRAKTEELIPLSVIAQYLGINISPVSTLVKRGNEVIENKPSR